VVSVGGCGYNVTNNLMIDSPPAFPQPGCYDPQTSLYNNQRYYFINIRQSVNNPEGMFPYCGVPTGMQFGVPSPQSGETGTIQLSFALFDVIDASHLTPYQQSYAFSVAWLPSNQRLVITNSTIDQINQMWGPYSDYLGTGNQRITIYQQLFDSHNGLIAYMNGTNLVPPPDDPQLSIFYGNTSVIEQMNLDLNQTWARINSERQATEWNESTSFLLSSIPNTLIPLAP
jgi:hypothetical protein